MDKAIQATLHNVIANYASTNVDHKVPRWLLVRIFIYQAQTIIAGHATEGHVPDITTVPGIIDLLYLQSFAVLAAAFDTPSYEAIRNNRLPIQLERFEELRVGWKVAESLLKFIQNQFTFTVLPEFEAHDDDSTDDEDLIIPRNFTEAAMVSIHYFCFINSLLICTRHASRTWHAP